MKKTVLLLVAALATNVSTYAGQPPSPDVEEWPGMQEAIAESMQTHREEEARRAAQASEITPANHEAGRQAITLHEISQVREQLQNIASDTKITQITIAGRDLPIRRFNGQIFVQIPTNGAGINMCPLMSLGTIPASTAAEAQAIATRIATNLQKLAKLHAPDGLASNFMVWSNGRNPADVPQEIFDGNGINYSVLWHFLTGHDYRFFLEADFFFDLRDFLYSSKYWLKSSRRSLNHGAFFVISISPPINPEVLIFCSVPSIRRFVS